MRPGTGQPGKGTARWGHSSVMQTHSSAHIFLCEMTQCCSPEQNQPHDPAGDSTRVPGKLQAARQPRALHVSRVLQPGLTLLRALAVAAVRGEAELLGLPALWACTVHTWRERCRTAAYFSWLPAASDTSKGKRRWGQKRPPTAITLSLNLDWLPLSPHASLLVVKKKSLPLPHLAAAAARS